MPKKFLRSRILFFLPFILFFIFSLQLILPQKYIVAGGDFYQLISYRDQLSRYSYAWFNQIGQGTYNPLVVTYPFYGLLTLVEGLFGTNLVAVAVIFLFLSLSYLSFANAIRILFSSSNAKTVILVSTIYAINNFVLAIFSYTWGYTHHFLMYIFLPTCLALFIRILLAKKSRVSDYFRFMVFVVISLPGANNIAFVFLLYLLELMIFIWFVAVRKSVRKLPAIFTKFVLLLFVQVVVHIWIILPIIISLAFSKQSALTSSAALGGGDYLFNWISSTSSNFFNTLTLTLDNYKFPFVSRNNNLLFILIALSYPILLLVLGLFHKTDTKIRDRRIILVAFGMYVSVSILAIRLYDPLRFVLQPLYLSPLFVFFRSSDKIFLALPLFFCLLLFLLARNFKHKNKVLFVFTIIISIPWLIKIPRLFLEADYNRFAQKIRPQYSYIVSIPREYEEIADIINNSPRNNGTVLSLPFSVVNSYNWANYPSWKYVGHDVLHLLFNRPYISANSFDNVTLEDSESFRDLVEDDVTTDDVLSVLSRFNAQYIIYHWDIDPSWIDQNKALFDVINELVNSGDITLISESQYFTLYEVVKSASPIVQASDSGIEIRQINPTLYTLNLDTPSEQRIGFLQSYDPAWLLIQTNDEYIQNESNAFAILFRTIRDLSKGNAEIVMDHSIYLNYANAWEIGKESGTTFVLLYANQLFIYVLLAVSGTISILSITYILKKNYES